MARQKRRVQAQIIGIQNIGAGGCGGAPIEDGLRDFLGAAFIAGDGGEQVKNLIGRGLVDVEFGGFRDDFDVDVAGGEIVIDERLVGGEPGRAARSAVRGGGRRPAWSAGRS